MGRPVRSSARPAVARSTRTRSSRADGRAYLLWKNYDGLTGIVGQELAAGRAEPRRADPAPASVADQPWEAGIVEAPSMVEHDGRYYLFYSGNDWATANYAIGYAVCDVTARPVHEAEPRAMARRRHRARRGPGSPDVFSDAARPALARAAFLGSRKGRLPGRRA